jgi:hypothetical protein
MTRQIDHILAELSQAPDTQIDHTITPRLYALIGKPISEIESGLHEILDDCAYAALASDFAMVAMDAVWNMTKEQLGEMI